MVNAEDEDSEASKRREQRRRGSGTQRAARTAEYHAKVHKALGMPQPGDIVGDKYRIEEALGVGGMGAVFAAVHLLTSKRVALKWLLPGVDELQGAEERLLREAKATARIDHPNVVNVFDVGRHASGLFLVMEKLIGQTLAERLDRERLEITTAIAMLMPALRGVAAAHEAGVVHRDLKPDNIFLCADPDGTFRDSKVLDFGISKLLSSDDPALTATGAMLGTPWYMAPEQVRGAKAVDQRADVYALGVILYELITDGYPYEAESFGSLMFKIVMDPPKPLREVCPTVEPGLAKVVETAMGKDPLARHATVEALAAALEPYAGGATFARLSGVPGPARQREATPSTLGPAGAIPANVDGPPAGDAAIGPAEGAQRSAATATATTNTATGGSPGALAAGTTRAGSDTTLASTLEQTGAPAGSQAKKAAGGPAGALTNEVVGDQPQPPSASCVSVDSDRTTGAPARQPSLDDATGVTLIGQPHVSSTPAPVELVSPTRSNSAGRWVLGAAAVVALAGVVFVLLSSNTATHSDHSAVVSPAPAVAPTASGARRATRQDLPNIQAAPALPSALRAPASVSANRPQVPKPANLSVAGQAGPADQPSGVARVAAHKQAAKQAQPVTRTGVSSDVSSGRRARRREPRRARKESRKAQAGRDAAPSRALGDRDGPQLPPATGEASDGDGTALPKNWDDLVQPAATGTGARRPRAGRLTADDM